MLFFYSITGRPNQAPLRLSLQGLDPDALYAEEGNAPVPGSTLMYAGIGIDTRHDMQASIRIFHKVK